MSDSEQTLRELSGRLEARAAGCDEMLPHLRRSRGALEEVVRRLEGVNQALGSRIALSKEAIRAHRTEVRRAAAACKEAQAARQAAEQQTGALQGWLETERQRRVKGLIRLQAEVERSLTETRQRALELKSRQEDEEYEAAEREAEEELARMRAAEDGRGFEVHLREIRERRHGSGQPAPAPALDPAVEAAVDKMVAAARAQRPSEAAAFAAACRERHASLTELKSDLETRIGNLRHELRAAAGELARSRASVPAAGAGDPEGGAMEAGDEDSDAAAMRRSVEEIEKYAASSGAVAAAMEGLLAGFESWAVTALARLVRAGDPDEALLRRVRALARRQRPERGGWAGWGGEALELLGDAVARRAEFLRTHADATRGLQVRAPARARVVGYDSRGLRGERHPATSPPQGARSSELRRVGRAAATACTLASLTLRACCAHVG